MLSRTNIEDAALHLLHCAYRMDGVMKRDWFVRGDAFYDQAPLAESYGLRKYLSRSHVLVYSDLEFLFFAGSLAHQSRGLGELKEDDEGFFFALTDAGKAHVDDMVSRGYLS
jgi:hypothetical protein